MLVETNGNMVHDYMGIVLDISNELYTFIVENMKTSLASNAKKHE